MSALLLAIANDQDYVAERFDHFEIKLERHLTLQEAYTQLNAIVDALAGISSRDKFALTVEISGDPLVISDQSEQDKIREHIENYHVDGGAIGYQIEVIKSVRHNRLSVYSLTAFGKYLINTPLSDVLAALAKRFDGGLIFECYSDSPGSGRSALRFVKVGDSLEDVGASPDTRRRSLELLQDNGYRSNITENLLPQDFEDASSIGVADVSRFMALAGAVLSAMFLSNVSELRGDQLDYRITGYKLLAGTVEDLELLVDDTGSFVRIATWACGVEGSSDKIGLARNVLSLCAQRLEDVPGHPEIWDAIQSNYQIYLKENIATYLEVRNKLAELLAESTRKTNALVEGLLDSIRNGVLIILTFLLTVVVINGLKDTGIKVIFSTEYLWVVLVLLALVWIVVFASCLDARSRFEQSAKATNQLLTRMYAHVMITKEIEEQVGPTIIENRAYLDRQAKMYQVFWACFAISVALVFLLGHCFFGRSG